MSSLNKVCLIGNLGKDPEIRTMSSGDRVANLSLATSETWRDKATGERKEKTEWHRVVIFNDNIVKVAENYLKKGSTVYLEGSLQTRKYEQNGVEKFTTEVIIQKYRGELTMLGGKDRESFSGGSDDGFSGGGGFRDNQDKGRGDFGAASAFDLNDPFDDSSIPF